MVLLDLKIFEVSVGEGVLALSPAPGRGDYQRDVAAIARWGADMVLTMVTNEELQRLGAEGLGDDLTALGIEWRHLPIADFGAPGPETTAKWPGVEVEALAVLSRGGKVLTHCYGGCGRSGMAALRIMVAAGEHADDALPRLRTIRPCAVETQEQLEWARLIQ